MLISFFYRLYRLSPRHHVATYWQERRGAGCGRRGRAGEAVAAMADHRDYFRQVAAECRRLAEIANKPEIKQRLLNMAAEYQAKADEHSNDR
jgi:hypothetical protein